MQVQAHEQSRSFGDRAASDPRNHILIVGSGFAGVGMAIRLKQAGIEDFTILEAAGEVGGTWRDNHYPGAACDVHSHLYSYSFEPNPHWSKMFAWSHEIFEYTKHCIRKYGIERHIVLNAKVNRAVFDERAGLWTVSTEDGRKFRGRIAVSATGPLSRPAMPKVKGLETFEGIAFHSARWDHTKSLAGLRVAVIGTGASAIQIVPEVQKEAAKVYLFQRTPAWVMPKPDREIGRLERELYKRVPLTQWLYRQSIYWRAELVGGVGVLGGKNSVILGMARRLAQGNIDDNIRDPELRRKLTPSYTPGCKRILLSNDYYPALAQPNVEVLTEGLAEVRGNVVVGADGSEREVDAIVLCTGFVIGDDMVPFEIQGTEGTLQEAWEDSGAEAYLGTSIAGFPNLFLIVGPNTGLGHNSIIFMIESQVRYVLDAIQKIRRENLKYVDVLPERQAEFNDEIQRRMADSVWSTGGCKSWYMNRHGKNVTLWPAPTWEFMLRTRHFHASAYRCVAESAQDRVSSVHEMAEPALAAE